MQNYLTTLSTGGMERYFYYFCRFTNCGPSQPTSRFGSGKELVEFDGSLRANAVGLSIASHLLDEARYHGPAGRDERLELHVFQKATRPSASAGASLSSCCGLPHHKG